MQRFLLSAAVVALGLLFSASAGASPQKGGASFKSFPGGGPGGGPKLITAPKLITTPKVVAAPKLVALPGNGLPNPGLINQGNQVVSNQGNKVVAYQGTKFLANLGIAIAKPLRANRANEQSPWHAVAQVVASKRAKRAKGGRGLCSFARRARGEGRRSAGAMADLLMPMLVHVVADSRRNAL